MKRFRFLAIAAMSIAVLSAFKGQSKTVSGSAGQGWGWIEVSPGYCTQLSLAVSGPICSITNTGPVCTATVPFAGKPGYEQEIFCRLGLTFGLLKKP